MAPIAGSEPGAESKHHLRAWASMPTATGEASMRARLQDHGVSFDFQYVSDSLWNLKSEQKERFASWNRFRGMVDIDFGALAGQHELYFHATALWQGGGNLGAYLGLLTSPSGMSSMNTCRLDSSWIEKRWQDERIVAPVGQFTVRISMELSTTRRPSSSNRWGMPWAIYLRPSSPSIRHPLRRWRSTSYQSTTST